MVGREWTGFAIGLPHDDPIIRADKLIAVIFWSGGASDLDFAFGESLELFGGMESSNWLRILFWLGGLSIG